MKHDFFDKYSRFDSPAHRLSARLKLSALAIFVFAVNLAAPSPVLILAAAAALAAVAVVGKIPILHVATRLAAAAPFAALPAFAASLSHSFRADRFLFIIAKMSLSVSAVVVFSSVTPFNETLRAARHFGLPRASALVISFLYRYFFVIVDELHRKKIALSLRGGGYSVGHYASAMAGVFAESYERSGRIYRAMRMRGDEFD